jgi:hypothetical protein
MPSNSFTAIVIIGGIALLIGLFGGGIEISNVKLPHLPGWQRALSGLIGIVLIVLGLVLDPTVRNPLSGSVDITPTVIGENSVSPTSISELPTDIRTLMPPTQTNPPNPPSPTPPPSTPTPILPTATPIPPTPAPVISCIAKEQGPLAQTDHTFQGPVHIVQLWRQNGQSPWGSNEVMAVVIGNVSIIAAGGNTWTYPDAGCAAIASVHMQDGATLRGSIVVTEQQLRKAGLIK